MCEFESEAEFKETIKNYLEQNNWTVKEEVPRKDCVGWEHPYTADLIIKHDFYYPHIGNIGLELKLYCKGGGGQYTTALKQILTKYQNNYFQGIKYPITVWGLVIDHSGGTGPFRHSSESLFGRFGVGCVHWCDFNKYKDPWNKQFNTEYRRLTFLPNDGRGAIFFEEQKMPDTDINFVKKLLGKKTNWINAINKSNIAKPFWVKNQ